MTNNDTWEHPAGTNRGEHHRVIVLKELSDDEYEAEMNRRINADMYKKPSILDSILIELKKSIEPLGFKVEYVYNEFQVHAIKVTRLSDKFRLCFQASIFRELGTFEESLIDARNQIGEYFIDEITSVIMQEFAAKDCLHIKGDKIEG